MSRSAAFSVNDAWNAVALEERLELIARAQADGVTAGLATTLLIGTIAYGFDEIWLLAGAVGALLFIVPLFTNYSWRRHQPALILAYLAVRTVARRYGYGYSFPDLGIVLIYRGQMTDLFRNKEEEEMFKQRQVVDFENTYQQHRDVWICLLRGGVVVLSERRGGAKLEFITILTHDVICRKPRAHESENEFGVVVEGAGHSRGRVVLLESKAVGAQYVFERQTNILIAEARKIHEQQQKLFDEAA